MDAESIDILSLHKQNIVRKLISKVSKWGLPPHVISLVIRHFHLGPQPHDNFNKLVERLAETIPQLVSVCGSPCSPDPGPGRTTTNRIGRRNECCSTFLTNNWGTQVSRVWSQENYKCPWKITEDPTEFIGQDYMLANNRTWKHTICCVTNHEVFATSPKLHKICFALLCCYCHWQSFQLATTTNK